MTPTDNDDNEKAHWEALQTLMDCLITNRYPVSAVLMSIQHRCRELHGYVPWSTENRRRVEAQKWAWGVLANKLNRAEAFARKYRLGHYPHDDSEWCDPWVRYSKLLLDYLQPPEEPETPARWPKSVLLDYLREAASPVKLRITATQWTKPTRETYWKIRLEIIRPEIERDIWMMPGQFKTRRKALAAWKASLPELAWLPEGLRDFVNARVRR